MLSFQIQGGAIIVMSTVMYDIISFILHAHNHASMIVHNSKIRSHPPIADSNTNSWAAGFATGVTGLPYIWEVVDIPPAPFLRRLRWVLVSLISDSTKGRYLFVFVWSQAKRIPWREGPASLARVHHRSQHCRLSHPGSSGCPTPCPGCTTQVFHSRAFSTLFCFVLLNVLTADVPRASVNPDGFLVSAGDRNVFEDKIHASRILSVHVQSWLKIRANTKFRV